MIKNVRYYGKLTSVYPGIYQPLQDKESELTNEEEIRPPVNIIEMPDHYRIEISAPDFEKDDFFIMTNKCSLSVVAIKRNIIKAVINLPADVDTDFGTAEYKNGMLYIFLYRSIYPVQSRKSQIIVH